MIPQLTQRLKLATPPFQFTYMSDGSRGDARKDHSWMENDTLRMKLDPAANTVAVTRSDTACCSDFAVDAHPNGNEKLQSLLHQLQVTCLIVVRVLMVG